MHMPFPLLQLLSSLMSLAPQQCVLLVLSVGSPASVLSGTSVLGGPVSCRRGKLLFYSGNLEANGLSHCSECTAVSLGPPRHRLCACATE